MTDKKLLTYADVIELTGLSEDTIQRQVNLNKLKIVKIGRRTGFRPETIDKWLKDSEDFKYPKATYLSH